MREADTGTRRLGYHFIEAEGIKGGRESIFSVRSVEQKMTEGETRADQGLNVYFYAPSINARLLWKLVWLMARKSDTPQTPFNQSG